MMGKISFRQGLSIENMESLVLNTGIGTNAKLAQTGSRRCDSGAMSRRSER
jgi:hypothetical protein